MAKYTRFISMILITFIILSICGCGSNQVKENYIYYLSETKNSLVKVDYQIKSDDVDSQISELLKNMNLDSEEGKYFTAKPEDVKSPEYSISEEVLTLYFEKAYDEINGPEEILYRASLVLTLTQVEGINYVDIYSGEQPLTDSNDVPIGNMTKSDFVDISGALSDLQQKISITMYLPNKKGDMLFEKTYEEKMESNKSLEELVMEKLSGKVYSKNVEVNSVITRNSVCYVDFSKNFNVEHLEIEDEIVIYSIVNSLCSLANVSRVKISIDGDSDLKFHENVSLDQNFTRNLDLVQ